MASAFEAFLEQVEVRQGYLLEELLEAKEACECGRMEDKERRDLIMRVLCQYEELYEEKSRASHGDVFHMFVPSWCSSLECAFLWLSGFRPTALFCLLSVSLPNLSTQKLHSLHRLKTATRMEEKALCDELARIQESISSPKIYNAMRRIGWSPNGLEEAGAEADEAMQDIRVGMEVLVANADSLRTRTATKVVEILSPAESIRFLIAATQLQRNMKIKGRERDAALAARLEISEGASSSNHLP